MNELTRDHGRLGFNNQPALLFPARVFSRRRSRGSHPSGDLRVRRKAEGWPGAAQCCDSINPGANEGPERIDYRRFQ